MVEIPSRPRKHIVVRLLLKTVKFGTPRQRLRRIEKSYCWSILSGMTNLGRFVVTLIIIIIVAIALFAYFTRGAASPAVSTTATTTPQTYGMVEYTDEAYGFTFWYPSDQQVTATTTNDSTSFPGGMALERLNVGTPGSIYMSVVQSASSTITDEPSGHAAPINQTKYFYDLSSAQWMVAYPEGSMTGTGGATTTADTSKTTIGGLPMLPSGARFDTTVIPLSTTEFLVIGDGGASSFTYQLAATVAASGAAVDPTTLSAALQAESSAYSQMGGQQ